MSGIRWGVVGWMALGVVGCNGSALRDAGVDGRPAIVDGPHPVLVKAGQTATFSVTAVGDPTPALTWQTRGANDTTEWTEVTEGDGATTDRYTTAAASMTDNGRQYRAVATNALGTAQSATATLSVSLEDEAPTIITPPASLTVSVGSDVVFGVAVRGTEPLTYQWRFNDAGIAGATGQLLRLPGVTEQAAGSYVVAVSNTLGTVTSAAANLTVTPVPTEPAPPTILTQPGSIEVRVGDTATFTVGATGSGLHYQWMRNGVSLAGATSEHYTTGALAAFDSGVVYTVVVYNSAGVVWSDGAVLTVTPLPDAGLPDAGSNPLSVNWGGVPGAWSFGYAVYDGGVYEMVPFDVVTRTTSILALTKSGYVSLGAPAVWRNLLPVPSTGIPSGALGMHPGPAPNADDAIIRFTAPQPGSYRFIGSFAAGDTGATINRVRTPAGFEDHSDPNFGFDVMVHLAEDDSVDFMVGNAGSYYFDSTPLDLSSLVFLP